MAADIRMTVSFVVVAMAAAGATSDAQKPPAIRQLGRLERVSSDSLASVAAAVPLSGGRVLIHDVVAHRVLLLDSTLRNAVVVADSTSATANAYGARLGTLIAFHRDSALFVDPTSLSMLVINPAGKVARIMAVPNPSAHPFENGVLFYTPGFDARERLVYFASPAGAPFPIPTPGVRSSFSEMRDSGFIVRADLSARTLDTVAIIRTPRTKSTLTRDGDGRVVSFELISDVLPLVDDWAVCSEGSVAIVRGRDYHVDWLAPDGKSSSSPKMPFDWQRLTDDQKTALIDSALKATKARRDSTDAAIRSAGASRPTSRAGSGGPAPTMIDGRPALTDVNDYRPPFMRASVHADADCNLWIRTTTIVGGQPVYDIVNRKGELFDRVQLPSFRTIAGFGPGVVYMAVKDAAGVVHLERARMR